MKEDKVYLSEEKFKQLKEDLARLKIEKRSEIAVRIEEAKKLGDLTENSEYMEAREAQEQNERRIIEIEDLLKRAVLIQKSKPTGRVQISSVIKVKTNDKIETYVLVGSADADPLHGKISNESPLGQALLDKKVGDVIEVKAPSGIVKYTILSIS